MTLPLPLRRYLGLLALASGVAWLAVYVVVPGLRSGVGPAPPPAVVPPTRDIRITAWTAESLGPGPVEFELVLVSPRDDPTVDPAPTVERVDRWSARARGLPVGSWWRASAQTAGGTLIAKEQVFEVRSDGEEPQRVSLTLVRPARIEGTVRDEHGQPVAGARVWCRAPWLHPRAVRAGIDGGFALTDIAEPLWLCASASGFADADQPDVATTSGEPLRLDLTLLPAWTLRGVAVDRMDRPLPGTLLANYGRERAELDAAGRFVFTTLPRRAEGNRVQLAWRGPPGVSSELPWREVTITDSRCDLGRLVFAVDYVVPVEVMDEEGRALPGVKIDADDEGAHDSWDWDPWQAAGSPTVTLREGRHRLTVRGFTLAAPSEVEVGGLVEPKPVRLVVRDAAVLEGRVLYVGEGPLALDALTLRAMRPGSTEWTLAPLRPDGTFRLSVPRAWLPVRLDVGSCDRFAVQLGGLGVTDDLETVLGGAQAAEPGVTLEIRIASRAVTGVHLVVVDAEEHPAPCVVDVLQGGAVVHEAQVPPEGRAALAPLPAGAELRFRLTAADGTRTLSEAIVLASGRWIAVRLRLRRSGAPR